MKNTAFRKVNAAPAKQSNIRSRQQSKQQQRPNKARLGVDNSNNNNTQYPHHKGFGVPGGLKENNKILKLKDVKGKPNNNNAFLIHQPLNNNNSNNSEQIKHHHHLQQQQLIVEQHKLIINKNKNFLKQLDNPVYIRNKKPKLDNPNNNSNNNVNILIHKPVLIKQIDLKVLKQKRPGSSIPSIYANNLNNKANKPLIIQKHDVKTQPNTKLIINAKLPHNKPLKLKLVQLNNPLSSSQVKTHPQLPSFIKDSGVYCTKNYRDEMEDTFDYNINFYTDNKITASYFAVFDGCGGDKISKYLKHNYQRTLLHHLKANNFNVQISFEKAFIDIDTKLFEIQENENKLKNSQTQLISNFTTVASTAVVILIINNVLYSANIGDSPCFYIDNNKIEKLSHEHNTSNEKELERVRKQGASVFNKRVFGALSLTRCIGGFEYKEYGVTTEPHIQHMKIKENGREVAVIGSDGLIEKMNEFELKTLIRENRDMSAQEYSEMLVKEAVNKGASDNITCIVVKLGK